MHACDGVVTGAIVYDHTSSLCGWHDKKGRWSCAIYTLLDPLVVCCHGQITIKSSGDVLINYLIFACVAK